MCSISQGFYQCNVGSWLTDNFYEECSLYNIVSTKLGQHCIVILSSQCCPNMSETKLHKKITCVILTLYWPIFFFLQENLRNVVLNYLGQHCIKQLPAQCRQFSPTGHSLVNIFQIRLRQNCTRKLLVQCWPRAHRYTFAGIPAVSNMSGDLFFNRVQHHRTILALCVHCWLGSPFTA